MTVPLHVVVIDDSLADLELTRVVFEQLQFPVDVRTYDSGGAALRGLRAPNAVLPDVILLDLNMPGVTGHDLLQTLKADSSLARIPVVILSTSTYPGDIKQAYAEDAAGYLQKQLSMTAFEEQLDTFVTYWTGQRIL